MHWVGEITVMYARHVHKEIQTYIVDSMWVRDSTPGSFPNGLQKNIKVVCSLLCSVQMKFPWSWNIISEYFYEEKKRRVVRYPPFPLRFVCFRELNNIWGLRWYNRHGPHHISWSDLFFVTLLIHTPAKIPEREITVYFDGKISISALPFGTLWIDFSVAAKHQLLCMGQG